MKKQQRRPRSVKGILTAALALIEKGWGRGSYVRKYRGIPRYCAMGAINMAATGDANNGGSVLGGRAATAVRLAAGTDTIYGWNDHAKSKKPVIAAFKQAIKGGVTW